MKTAKKSVTKKPSSSSEKKSTVVPHLSLEVLSAQGEKIESMTLPKELFGASYNRQLVSQAIRIYLMNQREGSAATKTRGMVEGSTRKIYRQKGTGRARHGGIRAPIFVGGGITFGPEPRDIRKVLPKQMKKKALVSALSYQVKKNMVKVVDGIGELPVKTKVFVQMLEHIAAPKRVLFVYGEKAETIVRAMRNINGVSVRPVALLNTYDVMTHMGVVFTKDAIQSMISQGAKK